MPDSGLPQISLQFKIQTYDIDYLRHVSNQAYIRWLEDLRMEFLRVHCPLDRLLSQDSAPVLYSTEVAYKRPLRLFDNPVGRMWLLDLGRATFTLGAEIHHAEHLCTTARQRGMLVNINTGAPMRWPEEFSRALRGKTSGDQDVNPL